MAYLPYDPQQDQDEQAQQQGQPQVLGSAAAGTITGSGAGGAQAQTPKGTRSGSFTNLMSYVNANKGNDAAMGSTVRGAVDQQASKAENAVGTFKTAAQTAADKGTVRQDDTVLNAIKNPTAGVVTDGVKKSFGERINAAYGGPAAVTDVEGYSDAQAQQGKLNSLVKQTGEGYEGASQLVDKVYARPSYNRGERSLDAFVLSSGDAGQRALGDIQQTYQPKVGALDAATQAARDAIEQGKTTTAATRKGLLDAVSGKSDEFKRMYDSAAATAGRRNADFDADYNALVAGKEDAWTGRGVSKSALDFLRNSGGDLGRLVTRGASADAADLMSPGARDSYKALQQLVSGTGASIADLDMDGDGQLAGADIGLSASVNDLNEIADLNSSIGSARKTDTAERELARNDPMRWLVAQGIDPQELIRRGIGPASVIEFGNSGTTVSPEMVKRYNELAGLLGVGSAIEATPDLYSAPRISAAALEALKKPVAGEKPAEVKKAGPAANSFAALAAQLKKTPGITPNLPPRSPLITSAGQAFGANGTAGSPLVGGPAFNDKYTAAATSPLIGGPALDTTTYSALSDLLAKQRG